MNNNPYGNNSNTKVKGLAFSGIITVLIIIGLYISSITPTNRIFFFCLSTVFISIVLIEYGTRLSIILYGSSAILGLILVPNKLIMVAYIIFFGYYGILKYYIERLNNILIEWVIKIIIFNLGMFLIYVIVLYAIGLKVDISKIFIITNIIIGEIIFIVYDYVYSIIITLYINKLRKKIF
ncbi:hypothetical protein [Clostridiisalibacter paucivorans]|uniref:hypothetical protein n=1 Tax=Clostridiisalibacter paucivorans TaxID=408753 RepID=UPI00047B3020|nr:hypothetical protein [Clostridiisalibacter paucivorans]